MPFEMQSKYNGSKCKACGEPIALGSTIIKHATYGWVHKICPGARVTRQAQFNSVASAEVETNSPAVQRKLNPSGDTPVLVTEIDPFDLMAMSDEPEAVEESPKVPFAPSAYQQAFYDAMRSTSGNIALKATAGSGKSTTLKNSTPYLDPNSKTAAIVFGKRNADDLKRVMPDWVLSCTTHSLALSNVRKVNKSIEVENNKVWHILRAMGKESHSTRQVIQDYGSEINKLVSLRKNTLNANFEYLTNHYGVILNGDSSHVWQVADIAFERSVSDMSVADFDDMLYWCATGKVPCQRFDTLLNDEVQDENQAQITFILNSLADGGRVLSVGDPMQSIYGFRGAALDAFDQLVAQTQASVMPLSITYRLPASHVEMVRQLFPEAGMVARENAPAGVIGNVPESHLVRLVKPGDMVLCRTNAPLIAPCFSLIRQGVKAMIAGRDIGKGLANHLDKCAKRCIDSRLTSILAYMRDYTVSEVSKLIAAEKDTQAASLQDQTETIVALADGCESVGQLKGKIDSVFSDDIAGVVFSSVHKSKGLESDNVYILQPDSMPSKWAKQPWEIRQEHNVKFVAYTRSKHGLYFVESEK